MNISSNFESVSLMGEAITFYSVEGISNDPCDKLINFAFVCPFSKQTVVSAACGLGGLPICFTSDTGL